MILSQTPIVFFSEIDINGLEEACRKVNRDFRKKNNFRFSLQHRPFLRHEFLVRGYGREANASQWHPDGSLHSSTMRYGESNMNLFVWGNELPTDIMGLDGQPIEVPSNAVAAWSEETVIHRCPNHKGKRRFARMQANKFESSQIDLKSFSSPAGEAIGCGYNVRDIKVDIEGLNPRWNHNVKRLTPNNVPVKVSLHSSVLKSNFLEIN